MLRSPHAHARILSVDTAAARTMPGVEAIFTGADLVADDVGSIPTLPIFKRPDGSAMLLPPRRLLAHKVVRFTGEPVAAIVAATPDAARLAMEAIVVDYDALSSVVDPIAAIAPDAPRAWQEAPDNIVAAMSYGDAAKVEKVFATAKHVVTLDVASQRLVPSAMEPRGTIAEIEKSVGAIDPVCAIADADFDPRHSRRRDPEAAEGAFTSRSAIWAAVSDRRPAFIRKTASSPMLL
jgi:Aerobic-type carbon monoxide dehydrogenase, large subunit CoxL/CutL homologs